jgi:hypothetical protein
MVKVLPTNGQVWMEMNVCRDKLSLLDRLGSFADFWAFENQFL